MPSLLTHTGMTDSLSVKNIFDYVLFRYNEINLRRSKAPRQKWHDVLGLAPYGRFDEKGAYVPGDSNPDLVDRIRNSSYYSNGIWRTEIQHPNGPEKPIKILHLTDTHIMRFNVNSFIGSHIGLLDEEYDLTVHSGDIVHFGANDITDGVLTLFREIRSPIKVSTSGNHDGWTWQEYLEISKKLEKSGFTDISYRVEKLDIKGSKFAVSGYPDRSRFLSHPHNGEKSWKMAIYNALPQIDPDTFRIGVFHRPCDVFGSFIDDGAEYRVPPETFNLILAGHLHDLGARIMGSSTFSAGFWLGMHGVMNGLNNHYGGYAMPAPETVFSIGPGSYKILLARIPLIHLYVPVLPRLWVRKAGPEIITLSRYVN